MMGRLRLARFGWRSTVSRASFDQSCLGLSKIPSFGPWPHASVSLNRCWTKPNERRQLRASWQAK